jgi:hypothetical protein
MRNKYAVPVLLAFRGYSLRRFVQPDSDILRKDIRRTNFYKQCTESIVIAKRRFTKVDYLSQCRNNSVWRSLIKHNNLTGRRYLNENRGF